MSQVIPRFAATMKKGKLIITDQQAFLSYLSSFPDGKKLAVTVAGTNGTRSLEQNSYLWGIVYKLICDHTGNTKEEMHEICKRMFLLPRFIEVGSRKYKLPGSSKGLNKPEMHQFIEDVRRWAAMELSVNIPDSQSVELN